MGGASMNKPMPTGLSGRRRMHHPKRSASLGWVFTLVKGRRLRAPLVACTPDQRYLGTYTPAIEEVAPEVTQERLLAPVLPRDNIEPRRRSTIIVMMA